MSSLHSCHWDWCRFTTVLHDDFVQHVISAHIDKAEPIKRGDIGLIRKVEQGPSGHSGELLLPHASTISLIDSFIGDVVSSAATVSQSEAPQSVLQPVGSIVSLYLSPSCFLFSHHRHYQGKLPSSLQT